MNFGLTLLHPVGHTAKFVSNFLEFRGGRYALLIPDRHIFLLAPPPVKYFCGGLIVTGFARNMVGKCLTDWRMSENLLGGFLVYREQDTCTVPQGSRFGNSLNYTRFWQLSGEKFIWHGRRHRILAKFGGTLLQPVGYTVEFVSYFLEIRGGRYALLIPDRHIFLLVPTSSKLFFWRANRDWI